MPLGIYKRGKWWHYRGTISGRELRGPCKTQDRKIAERVAAEAEQKYWQCRFDGPESVLTFAQAALLYRQAEKPTRFLDRIEDYWRDTRIKDISAGAIRQSAIALYPNGSPATRNRQCITPAQSIINHAADLEYCRQITVKRFPVERKEAAHVDRQWIDEFMRHAPPHLAALALFMFTTGARISESLAVNWSDIDLASQAVKIRVRKLGAERMGVLTSEMVTVLANLDRREPPFRYASRWTATKQWHKATQRAGIEPLTPHACRHGFATAMLQSGVDAVTVAKFGGWESPALVLSRYGHAADDKSVIHKVFRPKSAQIHADQQEKTNKSKR